MSTIRLANEPALKRSPGAPGSRRTEVSDALIRKIDLCRGLFAFLVVGAHAFDICWSMHPEAIQALPELARRVLFCTVQCGYYWVMGFFVISGYCIQLSVGRQLESGRFSLGVYLGARLTRIMPLYYLGLLFALAMEAIVSPIRVSFYPDGLNLIGWLSQLVFVQRFTQTFGCFAPSWTITYELFYYLFFGLLAAATSGSRGRAPWLGMLACVVLGGSMQSLYLLGYKDNLTLNFGMIFGLGSVWFMGALIANHGPQLARSRPARVVAMAWPLLLAASVVLRGSGHCPDQVIYVLLGVTFSMMILRFQAADVLREDDPVRTPRGLAEFARIIGLASYPTYLFHGPILLLLGSTISRWGWIGDWRVSWLVMTASGIGTGLVLGHFLERPIMAWRAGLLAQWKAASAGRADAIPAKLLNNPTVTGAGGT